MRGTQSDHLGFRQNALYFRIHLRTNCETPHTWKEGYELPGRDSFTLRPVRDRQWDEDAFFYLHFIEVVQSIYRSSHARFNQPSVPANFPVRGALAK